MISEKRIKALGRKLAPMPHPLTEQAQMEIDDEVRDCISYNSRYNIYYGITDYSFEGVYPCAVLEAVKEYQVLRFFDVPVYCSGEGIRKFYEDADKEEITEDDEESYYDDTEFRKAKECKRIWIDPAGEMFTEKLAHTTFVEDMFVNILSLQDWAHEPAKREVILSHIDENNYGFTGAKPILAFYLSSEAEYLRKAEKAFFAVCVEHEWHNEVIKFHKAFRTAHRHGFAFPTEYTRVSQYLDYLEWLRMDNPVYLTQPYYVAPTNFDMMYNRLQKRQEALKEKEEKRKAEKIEAKFREQHSWLFGIHFDTPNFHFQSLDSVEAYRIEGKIMHHCIYQCAYYDKEYYLSMHVSDHEGNRVATCTVDLKSRRIEQIQPMGNAVGYRNTYGKEWEKAKEYKEIRKALKSMMPQFPHKQEQTINQLKVA